jgi:hypothetical protein
MQAVGRFLRLLATVSGIVAKGTAQSHAANRLTHTAPHGFPHGAIISIQPFAQHQEERDVVDGQRFAVCLAQRILASSAELARGEVRTPLAWRKHPDGWNQHLELRLDLSEDRPIAFGSTLKIPQAEYQASAPCIEACNRPLSCHRHSVETTSPNSTALKWRLLHKAGLLV